MGYCSLREGGVIWRKIGTRGAHAAQRKQQGASRPMRPSGAVFVAKTRHADEVRLMFLDWKPGRRISRLPRWLHPLALLVRNVRYFPQAWLNEYRDWNSLNSREVRKQLTLSVQYVREADVSGDVAEFGTMTGRTAVDLARAVSKFGLSRCGRRRRLYLFDSFQGLPRATSPIDQAAPHVQDGVWCPGSCHGISKQQLGRLCQRHLSADRMRILDGWFSDTLSTLPAGTQFALMHIDSDLYQSAVDVLDFCFSRQMVAPAGIILFDDWDANRADPTFGERRAWSECVTKFCIEYTDCGQYGWGSRRLIVHAYQPASSQEPQCSHQPGESVA